MADVCYYADEEYSIGSVIVIEGDEYVCQNDGDPAWYIVVRQTGQPEPRPTSDTSATAGPRSQVCYYGGKKYSTGAPLKMPNGVVNRCQDGKWVPKQPQ
jgi:hypothetical protein